MPGRESELNEEEARRVLHWLADYSPIEIMIAFNGVILGSHSQHTVASGIYNIQHNRYDFILGKQ